MHRCMECKCKRNEQGKKAKCIDTHVWVRIGEETADAHKTRSKPKPITIASKETSGNKKTTPNKVVRREPTHQGKRTKCNNKYKVSKNINRSLKEGSESKKKRSRLGLTLIPNYETNNIAAK